MWPDQGSTEQNYHFLCSSQYTHVDAAQNCISSLSKCRTLLAMLTFYSVRTMNWKVQYCDFCFTLYKDGGSNFGLSCSTTSKKNSQHHSHVLHYCMIHTDKLFQWSAACFILPPLKISYLNTNKPLVNSHDFSHHIYGSLWKKSKKLRRVCWKLLILFHKIKMHCTKKTA